jgi:hypothetical protein
MQSSSHSFSSSSHGILEIDDKGKGCDTFVIPRSRLLVRIFEQVYSSSYQKEKVLSLNYCNEIQEAAKQDV